MNSINSENTEEINLIAILGQTLLLVKKKIGLIALTFVVCGSASALFYYQDKPTYSSTLEIQTPVDADILYEAVQAFVPSKKNTSVYVDYKKIKSAVNKKSQIKYLTASLKITSDAKSDVLLVSNDLLQFLKEHDGIVTNLANKSASIKEKITFVDAKLNTLDQIQKEFAIEKANKEDIAEFSSIQESLLELQKFKWRQEEILRGYYTYKVSNPVLANRISKSAGLSKYIKLWIGASIIFSALFICLQLIITGLKNYYVSLND